MILFELIRTDLENKTYFHFVSNMTLSEIFQIFFLNFLDPNPKVFPLPDWSNTKVSFDPGYETAFGTITLDFFFEIIFYSKFLF
jgi:hypothetical protein